LNLGPQTNLNSVVWGGDLFASVGTFYDAQLSQNFGAILTSADGLAWTPRDAGTNGALSGVVYGNGVFVAVGGHSFPSLRLVLSSPDGINWFTRRYSIDPPLRAVACGSGRFVAVGDGGSVLVSPDGISWEASDAGIFDSLTDVAYGNGEFLVRGVGAELLSSSNGVRWARHASPIAGYPSGGVTFGPNTFLLVGSQGSIVECDPVVRLDVNFNGLAKLVISGPAGRFYRIESADDLQLATGWQTLETTLLTNSPQAWRDSRPPSAQRFYRSALMP
jgi:hypothetical protein